MELTALHHWSPQPLVDAAISPDHLSSNPMTNDVLDVMMTGHLLPTDSLRTYEPLNRYVASVEFTHSRLQNGNTDLFNSDRSFDKHFNNQDDFDYDYDYDYPVNRNDEVLLTS